MVRIEVQTLVYAPVLVYTPVREPVSPPCRCWVSYFTAKLGSERATRSPRERETRESAEAE